MSDLHFIRNTIKSRYFSLLIFFRYIRIVVLTKQFSVFLAERPTNVTANDLLINFTMVKGLVTFGNLLSMIEQRHYKNLKLFWKRK